MSQEVMSPKKQRDVCASVHYQNANTNVDLSGFCYHPFWTTLQFCCRLVLL